MRTWYRNLDYWTLGAWGVLVAIGLAAIYSSTHGAAADHLPSAVRGNFTRQAMWAAVCFVGIGVVLTLPVRFIRNAAYPFYGATLVLLVLTLIFGREISGTRAWLVMGPVRLQASELAKVGTVLAVAQLLSTRSTAAHQNVRYALQAVAIILVPAVLIEMQNDTGTALIFCGLIPVMLFWSGIPISTVLLIISPAIAGYLALVYMPAAIAFAVLFTLGMLWHTRSRFMGTLAAAFSGGAVAVFSFLIFRVLEPYQVARLLSFTNPGAEEFRQGVGFHLVQSKAAIGSGGVWGQGFMEGTQTQGAYVPEQSTDFIFSVIGEEFGLVGALIVLALFAFLLLRLVKLGADTKHPFAGILAAGAVGVYLLHIFINIGMATGLLPVIGIPLPFLSYGGSALLGHTTLMALILGLHMRKDDLSIYGY